MIYDNLMTNLNSVAIAPAAAAGKVVT